MARRKESSDSTPEKNETSTPEQATGRSDRDRERIASRAYELYLARGGIDGRDLDDWLDAERELTERTPDRDER